MMKFSGFILLALNFFSLGGARGSTSESETTISNLNSVVSLLAERIKDLEDSGRSAEQVIQNLETSISYLEANLEELEQTVKKGREEISSLKRIVHTVEQRNLQLANGPLTNRPVVNIGPSVTNSGNSGNADDSPCMPRYVNNRCIFGGTPDVVAIRFENATFFNDNVEFNENVGFDEDADCMPRYNRTSDQCILNNNFRYDSGNVQFQSPTKVTFRSREVWIRPKRTFFRNTNTSFQGGALNIRDDVDVIN